jgi:DNA polymerase III alpha subunit
MGCRAAASLKSLVSVPPDGRPPCCISLLKPPHGEKSAQWSELSPLVPMTPTQRTFSDFTHSGLTLGKHPIAFHRGQLRAMGVLDNGLVKKQRDGAVIQVAGLVITRQRPGTAKGFVFLTLEDETGVLNVIVKSGPL